MNEIFLSTKPDTTWVKQSIDIKRLVYPGVALLGDDLIIVGGFDWSGWTAQIRKFNEGPQTLTNVGATQIGDYPIAYARDTNVLGFHSGYSTNTKYLWAKGTTTVDNGGAMSAYVRNRVAISCYVGDKITANRRTFLFGGAGASTTQMYMINHATAVFSLVRSDVRLHGEFAMGCEVGGALYVFGGINTTPKIFATKYDPVTNQLTTLANMPSTKYGGACIAIDNDTIHLIGGISGNESTATNDTIFEYKISTNTWKILSNKFSDAILYSGYAQNEKAAYIVGTNATIEGDQRISRIWKMKF